MQPPRSSLFAQLTGVLAACGLTMGCDQLPSSETPIPAIRLPAMVESVDAGQWPGWRGAALQGVSPAQAAPLHWSLEGGGVRWTAEVPGEGNSSPIVWNDRIFLSSLVARSGQTELAILCFDRRDGKELWRRELGPPAGRTHLKNGHASATLATDGRRVVACFGAAGLFCYDLDGHRLWRADLGTLDHEWGLASSPIFCGDLVIQLCDSSLESYVAAWNKTTGERVWRTARQSSGSWSTPVLVDANPDDPPQWELVINGTGSSNGAAGYVIGYDPSSGKELWRVKGTSDIPCPTPIAGDGLIVSASAKTIDGNGPLLAIRPGGRGDVTQSNVLWRRPSGGSYVPTGLIYNDRLFVVSDGGVAACYDVSDGNLLWQKRLYASFSASLVAAENRIYAVSEQGEVHVFAAADEFQPLAVNRLPEQCLSTPAIAHGEIYIRSEHRLYCLAAAPQRLQPTAAETNGES